MNSIARKYPVYKDLALEVGDRIRTARTAPAFDPEGEGYDMKTALEAGLTRDETGHMPSRHPVTGQMLKGRKHATHDLELKGEEEAGYKISKGKDGKYYSKKKAAMLSKLTRGAMRTTGLEQFKTSQHIMDNKDKIPQPTEGESFMAYQKRFKQSLGLEQREAEKASKGTIAQFEDHMTVGIAAGMMTHPAGTLKMLAWFGTLEAGSDVLGINKAIENIPNVDVKDTLELVKFGVEGAIAGGLTKHSPVKMLKNMRARKAGAKKVNVDAAAKVVNTVMEKIKTGETPANPATIKHVEMTLGEALAKAEKATKTQKKVPIARSKVEQAPKPPAKVKPKPEVVDTVKIESAGKKANVPLVETYKGKQIVKTGDNFSVWDAKKKTLFRVALDDSKTTSSKKFINSKTDNVEGARKYIDWVVDAERKSGVGKTTIDVKAEVTDPKIARLEKIKDIADRRKKRTTSSKDLISASAEDKIDVTVRLKGQDSVKKMTSKQLFELKEQIREGTIDARVIEKTQKAAESKATALEREADKLLGKRTIKDTISDVGDAIGGKSGAAKKITPQERAKREAAVSRLQADAKASGKELEKYLVENLKLDSASASVILKASQSPSSFVNKVKDAKQRPVDKSELDLLPAAEKDAIVQEKFRNSKGPAHKRAIQKKYGIKEDTPTSDPAIVKDTPALDPLMDKETLFNPKDKASMRLNERINRNLDRATAKAQRIEAKTGKKALDANNWIDTTLAMQSIQEKTGAPMYSKVYLAGVEIANKKEAHVAKLVDNFVRVLKKGSASIESDTRIVEWITKRKGTLSVDEQRTANKLSEIFRTFEPMVKYLRMRDWIEGLSKAPKDAKKLVTQGRRIYKKQGIGALEQWVKDKDFGVIKNDRYVPAEILRGLRTDRQRANVYESILPHTKARTTTEQRYDNTVPLAKRLHTYMERVLGNYYFRDYLKNTQETLKPYGLEGDARMSIENWLGIIQGHGIPGIGRAGKLARKARGQFFKTILFDPTKWVRNKLQNVAFLYQNYPLTMNIRKIATRNFQKIDKATVEFFKTHVSQLGALRKEYMYLYETKQRGPLGKLDRAATKVAEVYTLTDESNRWTAFIHVLAGLKSDMAKYKAGKMNYNKFATRNGLHSFTDLEVKHVMGLKPEEAALQIARFMVEKTHVRYKKFERGFGALSEMGEAGTSLTQFPKTVIARFADSVRMVAKGKSLAERKRGLDLLAGYVMMPIVANNIFQRIVGPKKYYDPDLKREVEYKPYGFFNAVTGITFGGAQVGQVSSFFKAVKLISEVASQSMQGGFDGRKGHKRKMTLIREILKISDSLGESFIPFLRKSMDVLESMTDKQTYKLLTTTFDKMTNRRSALRRNKAERDTMQQISHAFFGTERE